jgi:hypothetical protein
LILLLLLLQHEKSGEQTLQNRYTIFSGAVVSFSGAAITGDYAPIFSFFGGFCRGERAWSLYDDGFLKDSL